MGPDLAALFGEDVEPEEVQVHPALLSAVSALLGEAWPVARAELLGEATQEAKDKEPRLPLPPRLARDMDDALGALERRAWAECAAQAEKIKSEAWAALMRDKTWQRPCDKELFILVQLLLALCAHASASPADAMRHVDEAFVFAAAGPFRSCALLFVRLLDEDAAAARRKEDPVEGSFPAETPAGSTSGALERLPAPSPQELGQLLSQRRPFRFGGALEAWPARKWTLQHLDQVAGHRLVPTELGRADSESGELREELMPLGRFLRDHLAPSCRGVTGATTSTAYLAQHELFEQCPVLRADVPVPSCWQQVLGAPSRCNAWVGTSSTVTPCHWDSYDNFLAQVQGFKRVALLAPEQRSKLYVEESVGRTAAQGNLSPVNVEDPDLEKYPNFAGAEVLVLDLSPGDVLHIPSGWWHQVRSLTASISVNFWY
ncbi:unnamed protein product [Effrenium voratum]|uniref:JmjC domain-containing protein n=1 Tax=Effrenium voratum TaxID=2562239 RepID=A0AA36I057_9DINO|nr:unnamed protein product [Effrenium voratum]CAJ1422889.1 unnamed protein product [Effrenium voratum]CAJ1439583.1 unnamed protein product [Effrenium voratum]